MIKQVDQNTQDFFKNNV